MYHTVVTVHIGYLYSTYIMYMHIVSTKYIGVPSGKGGGQGGLAPQVKLKRYRNFAINQKKFGNFLKCGPLSSDPVPPPPVKKLTARLCV